MAYRYPPQYGIPNPYYNYPQVYRNSRNQYNRNMRNYNQNIMNSNQYRRPRQYQSNLRNLDSSTILFNSTPPNITYNNSKCCLPNKNNCKPDTSQCQQKCPNVIIPPCIKTCVTEITNCSICPKDCSPKCQKDINNILPYYNKYKSWIFCTDTRPLSKTTDSDKETTSGLLNTTNYSSTNMTLLTAVFFCQWVEYNKKKGKKTYLKYCDDNPITWYDLVSKHFKCKYQQNWALCILTKRKDNNDDSNTLYNYLNQYKSGKLKKGEDFIWTPNISSYRWGVKHNNLVSNIWDKNESGEWKPYQQNLCLNSGLGCGNICASTYAVSRCFYLLLMDDGIPKNDIIKKKYGSLDLPNNYMNYFFRWGNGLYNESAFEDLNYRGLIGNRLDGKWIYNVGYVNGLFNMTEYENYPQVTDQYFPTFIEISSKLQDSDNPPITAYNAIEYVVVGHPGATYGSNSLLSFGALKNSCQSGSKDVYISIATATNIGNYQGLYMTEIRSDIYYNYLWKKNENGTYRHIKIDESLENWRTDNDSSLEKSIENSIKITLKYQDVLDDGGWPPIFYFSIGITKFTQKAGEEDYLDTYYRVFEINTSDDTFEVTLCENNTSVDKTKFLFGSGFTKFLTSLNTTAIVKLNHPKIGQNITYSSGSPYTYSSSPIPSQSSNANLSQADVLWSLINNITIDSYLTNTVLDFKLESLTYDTKYPNPSTTTGYCLLPDILNNKVNQVGMKQIAYDLYMDTSCENNPKPLWNPLVENKSISQLTNKYNFNWKDITLANMTCMTSGLKDFDGTNDELWYKNDLDNFYGEVNDLCSDSSSDSSSDDDDNENNCDYQLKVYQIPLGPFMWAAMTQFKPPDKSTGRKKKTKHKHFQPIPLKIKKQLNKLIL